MKISMKYIIAVICLLCFSAFISHAQKNAIVRNTRQAQEWYNIETNEKSIELFGENGSTYYRIYDKRDSTTYTKLFKEHYLYDNGSVNPDTLEDCNVLVKMSSVKTFFDEAKSLGSYNSSEDFTAIRIVYGMEGRKLIMIFQPIVLDRIGSMINGGYNYDTIPSPNRYRVNNDGSLRLLNSAEYQTLIDAYRSPNSNIYMDKVTTDSHKYIPDTSIASCILALQDVIGVYLQNLATDQSVNINDKIIFSFIASSMKLYENDEFDYEQHVVVYYRLGLERPVEGKRFKSYGADYSQLCPPHCGNNAANPIWIKTSN